MVIGGAPPPGAPPRWPPPWPRCRAARGIAMSETVIATKNHRSVRIFVLLKNRGGRIPCRQYGPTQISRDVDRGAAGAPRRGTAGAHADCRLSFGRANS